MVGKVLSGGIVVFWLVMMGALVRVEFFPEPPKLGVVPMKRVLHKIFANSEPARLNVYRQKERIGSCTFDVAPLASLDARLSDPIGPRAGAYRIQVRFLPSQSSALRLQGDGWCDSQYEIQRFSLKASWGEMHLKLSGDNQTAKVDVVYEDGDIHHERHFGLNEVGGKSLSDALGIPLPASAGLLGMAGLPTTASGSDLAARTLSQPTTEVYYGRVPIGDLPQVAYLIESKLNEAIWAKVWVDESGEVLLVETSMGFTMRSAAIDDLSSDGLAAAHGGTAH